MEAVEEEGDIKETSEQVRIASIATTVGGTAITQGTAEIPKIMDAGDVETQIMWLHSALEVIEQM